DISEPSWRVAVPHPGEAQGIVVQIVEAGPASEPAAEIPPGVTDPPPPVRLLGLRLRARAKARAIGQWRGLLGGSVDDRASNDLIFRWPNSPLRLAVDIDPAGPRGQDALSVLRRA